jgi:hypothetical protein
LKTTDIVLFLRQARATLKDHQKRHLELRGNHLLELAEARVLAKRPHLETNPDTKELMKQREKELRHIIYKEKKTQMFKKIGYLLYPGKYSGRLSSIDIPHSFPAQPLDKIDPKTWTGSWKAVTDPTEIAERVATTNAQQYHQAHDTPFGTDPLKSYFRYRADTEGAEQLVRGILPPQDVMQQLLPETRAILHYLAQCPRQQPKMDITVATHPPLITTQQFQSLYKAMDERTSSSPSGRHLGHYKVAATSDQLASLHAQMMSIPYRIGFSPVRWRQVIDVMLEKKPGDRRLHRLRIVALQESDFNQSNRLLIGRPLLHNLADTCAIPDIQHGSRPSKLCQSAVLNKVLTIEIYRYRKQTLAYIENDAMGCYDRIVNPLALLFLRILGLAPTIIASLAKTWETTYHRIKTIYGISNHQYANSFHFLLYGPGQGSTIGPFLWLLCFILIFFLLKPQSPQNNYHFSR